MLSPSKRHISYFSSITAISLLIWFLLSLLLSLQVGWGQLHVTELLGAFVMGLWFDIATLAYYIAPLLLFSVLVPARLTETDWWQKLRWFAMFVLIYLLLFGVIAEFIFWQEFTTRFNFIAVDYLVYTHEVIGNIRESYPVPLILLAIALLALALVVFECKELHSKLQAVGMHCRGS